jgi:hypothetical protein
MPWHTRHSSAELNKYDWNCCSAYSSRGRTRKLAAKYDIIRNLRTSNKYYYSTYRLLIIVQHHLVKMSTLHFHIRMLDTSAWKIPQGDKKMCSIARWFFQNHSGATSVYTMHKVNPTRHYPPLSHIMHLSALPR